MASRELAKHGGKGTVIHNLITSWSVPEVVKENGGTPVRTRVGHSFIKAEMATTGAIFGGEHSAHYYFKDFWNADTGMLAALHVWRPSAARTAPCPDWSPSTTATPAPARSTPPSPTRRAASRRSSPPTRPERAWNSTNWTA